MKSFLISFICLCSLNVSAANKEPAFVIQFQSKNIHHIYTLMEKDKNTFSLIFKDGKNAKTKIITRSEGLNLVNDLTHITWQSEYRRPADITHCTPYASVKLAFGKETQICRESPKAVGSLFGLLNNLAAEMKSAK